MTEKPQRDLSAVRHPPMLIRRCPPYFTSDPNSRKCYRVSSDRVTWKTARERCRLVNAELVAIETSSEQQFINMLAGKQAGKSICSGRVLSAVLSFSPLSPSTSSLPLSHSPPLPPRSLHLSRPLSQ